MRFCRQRYFFSAKIVEYFPKLFLTLYHFKIFQYERLSGLGVPIFNIGTNVSVHPVNSELEHNATPFQKLRSMTVPMVISAYMLWIDDQFDQSSIF